MDGRLHAGGVVEKHVEKDMTFVFVGAIHTGIDRNVVGNQRVSNNAFFQTEISG